MAQFEAHLLSYLRSVSSDGFIHISLPDAYEAWRHRVDGGKLFSAILDIVIGISILWVDSTVIGGTVNNLVQEGQTGATNGEARSFYVRMQLHRESNAFVLRYRSLWDKVMNFLMQYFAPDKVKEFENAKSKRRAFARLMSDREEFPPNFVKNITEMIERFDNTFRTGEAHGTGTIRKWSFDWVDVSSSQHLVLITGYWNVLNEVAHYLGAIIKMDTEQLQR